MHSFIKKLKQYFPKSDFSKNVITLITGAAIAQLINVLISPVLTRLYSPEDFGMLAIFLAIVSLLVVFSTMRYEHAIVLPKKDSEALHLMILSFYILSTVVILLLFICFLFSNTLVKLIGYPKTGSYLYLIPIGVFFTGLYQILNYWFLRKKKFRLIPLSKIYQAITMAAGNSGLGIMNIGWAGLLIGTFFSRILAACYYMSVFFKDFLVFKPLIKTKNLMPLMKKYKDFPTYNTPIAFIEGVRDYGIVFFIMYIFSTTIIGLYDLAFRVIRTPAELISNAMSKVFFQEASILFRENGDISLLVKKMYKRQLFIGLPVFLILFLFTPQFFIVIFGKEWYDAGIIAQILIPPVFLSFIVSSVSTITLIAHKQKEAFIITLVEVLLRIISIIIGGLYHSYKLAFLLTSIFYSLVMLFNFFWYYKIAVNSKSNS